MNENITFSAKITERDLFRYNIHHAYTSMQGIFSVIVSVLIFAVWIMRFDTLSQTYLVLYPVIAILFLIYIPINLKLKSKQQILQEVFSYPLNYEFTETGIVISSPVADEPAELPWKYIYKIVTWKEYLLIYSNRLNAYIVPRSDISSQYDEIVLYIKEHVEDYRLTIK